MASEIKVDTISEKTSTNGELYFHNGNRSDTGVTITNLQAADMGTSDVYLWGSYTYMTTN